MLLDDPVLQQVADACKRTKAQVLLRYVFQLGYSLVAKSSNVDRQRENLALLDFVLDSTQTQLLDNLERNYRFCGQTL